MIYKESTVINVSSDNELLNSIYKQDGMGGIVSLARARQNEGRYAGAALALAYAIEKATIVIESDKKTILIHLSNERYSIYVWIPEYNTFVDFGFSAGIGYGTGMALNIIAARLIDAIDFLSSIEIYLTSDPVAFATFKPLFLAEQMHLKRTFSIFV